jgi:hypothetical protein
MIDEDVKIELNEAEIETLRKIHNATAIRQTIQTPGWDIISDIITGMVARCENQHLNFAPNATRDAYWASGLKLAGAREFAKILQDQIKKETDLNLVPPTRTRPAEE